MLPSVPWDHVATLALADNRKALRDSLTTFKSAAPELSSGGRMECPGAQMKGTVRSLASSRVWAVILLKMKTRTLDSHLITSLMTTSCHDGG